MFMYICTHILGFDEVICLDAVDLLVPGRGGMLSLSLRHMLATIRHVSIAHSVVGTVGAALFNI